MKKIFFFYCLLSIAFSHAKAQVNISNMGFNYSSLVRDSAGRPQPAKAVKLRFTLLLGSTGTTVNSPWIETQNTTTDSYGFVNVTIGGGTKTGGTAANFAAVDFSLANYWLLIEVMNAANAYVPLSKQPLQAVPYAKVAGSVVGSGAVPPGTIVAFGGDTAHIPAGWFFCDGRELNNTDPRYLPLFNAIGFNWGTSDGQKNLFNIPYLQGLFLRGAYSLGFDPDADNRGVLWYGGNAGNTVGSYQADAIKFHSHNINVTGGGTGPSTLRLVSSSYTYTNVAPTTTGTANEGFADETRPRNVYVTYIIKL